MILFKFADVKLLLHLPNLVQTSVVAKFNSVVAKLRFAFVKLSSVVARFSFAGTNMNFVHVKFSPAVAILKFYLAEQSYKRDEGFYAAICLMFVVFPC